MGKRVLQADGSYCYTVGCRIHDRGSYSGVEEIRAENERRTIAVVAQDFHSVIDSYLPEYKTQAKNIANHLVDYMYNSEDSQPQNLVEQISGLIYEGQEKAKIRNYDRLLETGYELQRKLVNSVMIQPGDQIFIKATGERGTAVSGSPFSKIRIETDDHLSENSYQYFDPAELVKIQPPKENDKVKNSIFAMPKDHGVSPKDLAALFDEETNDNVQPNPPGVHGVTDTQARIIREEFLETAERVLKGFRRSDVITRDRITSFLKAEANKRRSWLDEEDAAATSEAYKRLMDYINPKS